MLLTRMSFPHARRYRQHCSRFRRFTDKRMHEIFSCVPSILPLRALQVLETAARHGSFARAADELNITQSAVSHQIRGLEARLGTKLFFREHKRLVLTPAGHRLALVMSSTLGEVAEAMTSVRPARDQQSITVSTLPSMAYTWLVPRLNRFLAQQPTVDVNIVATAHLSDPGRDGSDLAIRYGNGRWPGLQAMQLLSDSLFPVCAPKYNRGKLPRSIAELLSMPLLSDLSHPWRGWFREVGATVKGPLRLSTYTDAGLLLQAAERGIGIALGRRVLAADALASGRLVRPIEQELRSPYRYFVVYRSGATLRPPVQAFVDWLLSEASGAA
jgi:LysR family glycine cleavage system transcriptional activator